MNGGSSSTPSASRDACAGVRPFQAIALTHAFQIVVVAEGVEVALDLVGLGVTGLTAGHAEALVEQGAVHAFDEAVGVVSGRAWCGTRCRASPAATRRGVTLSRHRTRGRCPLTQHRWRYRGLVERQHALIEGVGGRDRHLRDVDRGEGEQNTSTTTCTYTFPTPLSVPQYKGVLVRQFAGAAGRGMVHAEVAGVSLQKTDLPPRPRATPG